MKKKMRRALSLAGSAVLVFGLFTGFRLKTPGALAVTGQASSYSVIAGRDYTVNADYLNVRIGPGLNYERRAQLQKNALVSVLEVRGDWARIRDGWVNVNYLTPADQISHPNSLQNGVTTVDSLNIRSGPGTRYPVVGRLYNGYSVTVTETKDGWGRIQEGWICLDYVKRTGSADSSSAVSPSAGPIRENSNVIVTADRLNIRANAGTGYQVVGQLTNGQGATILEIRNGWGRIREGWISLNYVRAVTPSGTRGYFVNGDTVQVKADSLRMRMGPGSQYAVCGSLMKGCKEVLQDIDGQWGKIDGGWICLDYVSRMN